MVQGIGVSKGYAIGVAYLLDQPDHLDFSSSAEHPREEAARLSRAIEKSKAQVRQIVENAHRAFDEKNAAIVESHLAFLDDPAFVGEAFSKIKTESATAEKAISDVTESLYQMFSEFDDEYTRERAADIRDVGERILNNLLEKKEVDFKSLPQNTILFAHDLQPSQTAQIDRKKTIAFVTEAGGKTSHTSILAKALGIAAVVGCGDVLSKVKNGMTVIVDGHSGQVSLSPNEAVLKQYRALQTTEQNRNEMDLAASKTKIHAKSGKRILVTANIGNPDELKTALKNGADGVGLFRTEFLYMGKQSLPSEEEQFKVYREAADLLNGKPLTIRTLDIGGDKSLPYLTMPKESNPFLGLRAIRLCLKRKDIFETQLRAILRAAAYGNIQVMFPMIGSAEELSRAKELLKDCGLQLKKEGIPYNPSLKTGMMIEIPSAAILADDFAKSSDFFSIGTNDLTQYTLAVDRMSDTVSDLYDPMHPAVLRLIHMTIDAAHRASIPCYMCGELASDERAIPLLLQYGLDEFSVSPGLVAATKSNLLRIASGAPSDPLRLS
jgi:phosphotransferase system enzyme I (PtsI)